MEPLSEQQNEFLINSIIAETRHEIEAEKHDDRRYYEDALMRQEIQEMQENYHDLQKSRTVSHIADIPKHAFENPKAQRLQDKAYQEILTASKEQQ
jgi:hypothetical protein